MQMALWSSEGDRSRGPADVFASTMQAVVSRRPASRRQRLAASEHLAGTRAVALTNAARSGYPGVATFQSLGGTVHPGLAAAPLATSTVHGTASPAGFGPHGRRNSRARLHPWLKPEARNGRPDGTEILQIGPPRLSVPKGQPFIASDFNPGRVRCRRGHRRSRGASLIHAGHLGLTPTGPIRLDTVPRRPTAARRRLPGRRWRSGRRS